MSYLLPAGSRTFTPSRGCECWSYPSASPSDRSSFQDCETICCHIITPIKQDRDEIYAHHGSDRFVDRGSDTPWPAELSTGLKIVRQNCWILLVKTLHGKRVELAFTSSMYIRLLPLKVGHKEILYLGPS